MTTKRCGTCELLERSSFPGLATYGKCPHRPGWVRTQAQACEHHLAEKRGGLVRFAMVVNLTAAAGGLCTALYLDVTGGTLVTHLIFAFILTSIVAFAWFIRRSGFFSEDAKYELIEREDPPPEEDRDIPFP